MLDWLILIWDIHLWIDNKLDRIEKEKCDKLSDLKIESILKFTNERVWKTILQIWDLGVNKDALLKLLSKVKDDQFKILLWNRDHYETLFNTNNVLSNYWTSNLWWNTVSFLRGAKTQNINRNYVYKNEELSDIEMDDAYLFFSYDWNKWNTFITHVPPLFISKLIYKENIEWDSTEHFLWKLRDIYKPKYHIFWHYHKLFYTEKDWTKFICLWEMETLDISDEILFKINSLEDLKKEMIKINTKKTI